MTLKLAYCGRSRVWGFYAMKTLVVVVAVRVKVER